MQSTPLQPYFDASLVEAGCDEAGRGCLAGPVFAAAVILPTNFYHPLLNDSKQLSEKQRMQLKPYIEEHAIAFSVAMVDHEEIDRINILNASILAMHKAVQGLHTLPQLLLIDGNKFKPYPQIPHRCVVKGDSIFASIAAASVLAKTNRDLFMDAIDAEYPQYGWKKNKGYATLAHRKCIKELGPSPYHRRSFRWYDEQATLF